MLTATNNFDRMCRTCMHIAEAPLEQLRAIYEMTGERQELIANVLKEAMPKLKIETEDGLPKMICSSCMEKLLNMYDFQHLCFRTERHLRSLLDYSQQEYKFEIRTPLATDDVSNELGDFESLEELVEKSEPSELAEEENDEGASDPLNSVDDDGIIETIAVTAMDNCVKMELEGVTEYNTLTDNADYSAAGDTFHSESMEADILHFTEVHGKKGTKLAERMTAITKRITRSPKEHKCMQCGKLFKKAYALTRHQQVHEREKAPKEYKAKMAKPYVCEYCNKAFQQSCTLKDHKRIHTGEQPYLCSECGRAFNSASNMKQHLLRHGGLKRYECPDCPKKFPCPSDLASHKAVHNKLKPHSCEICGAAFGKPFQLKKHKMYHNNEKPHKCEYCDRRFVCADHMRRHARTHTGEKPYQCQYCPRAFAQSNDLIKHLRIHLGDNVYRCEFCPKAYRLAAELREHFVVHKNESDATRQRNLKELRERERQFTEILAAKSRPSTATSSTKTTAKSLCLS